MSSIDVQVQSSSPRTWNTFAVRAFLKTCASSASVSSLCVSAGFLANASSFIFWGGSSLSLVVGFRMGAPASATQAPTESGFHLLPLGFCSLLLGAVLVPSLLLSCTRCCGSSGCSGVSHSGHNGVLLISTQKALSLKGSKWFPSHGSAVEQAILWNHQLPSTSTDPSVGEPGRAHVAIWNHGKNILSPRRRKLVRMVRIKRRYGVLPPGLTVNLVNTNPASRTADGTARERESPEFLTLKEKNRERAESYKPVFDSTCVQ